MLSDDEKDTSPSEVVTAKGYAERVSGRPLANSVDVTRLRRAVNAKYLTIFKKSASTVLAQVHEGLSIVSTFYVRELAHPEFDGFFDLKNIKDYSAKIATIIKNINESDGIVFIYSQFNIQTIT